MKKTISIFLALCVILTLFTACGSDELTVESTKWKLQKAVNIEKEGQVVAVGERNEENRDIPLVDVTLVAIDGEITITDHSINETHTIAYEEMNVTDDANDYKLLINGKEGYMVFAENGYFENESKPTLVLTVDGYDLYFYSVIGE